jgi:hypothetical protein
MKNQRKSVEEKKSSESFDHLTDRVDEQEKTKQTLKKGLLSFLNRIEADEKLPRKK